MGQSLLDTVMLALWEDCAEQGLFRYDVTACATKVRGEGGCPWFAAGRRGVTARGVQAGARFQTVKDAARVVVDAYFDHRARPPPAARSSPACTASLRS